MNVSFIVKHSNFTCSSTVTPGKKVRMKKGKQGESIILKYLKEVSPEKTSPLLKEGISPNLLFSSSPGTLLKNLIHLAISFAFLKKCFLKDGSKSYLKLFSLVFRGDTFIQYTKYLLLTMIQDDQIIKAGKNCLIILTSRQSCTGKLGPTWRLRANSQQQTQDTNPGLQVLFFLFYPP